MFVLDFEEATKGLLNQLLVKVMVSFHLEHYISENQAVLMNFDSTCLRITWCGKD